MKESDTGCKRLRNSNNCPHFFAEGEPRMPMLNWMIRETATNGVNDVDVKILREVHAGAHKMGSCYNHFIIGHIDLGMT